MSQEAGTTRDVVEVSLDIRGYLCTFADTAGLRTGSGEDANLGSAIGAIEHEGIRRAKAKAGESDVIIVLASVEPLNIPGEWQISYDAETLSIAANALQSIVIINKVDRVPGEVFASLVPAFKESISRLFPEHDAPIIAISCKDAKSSSPSYEDPGHINLFINELVYKIQSMTELPVELEDLLGVTERQRQLLASCSQNLIAFLNEAQVSNEGRECDIVLAAEHLRSAANCLSRITGRGRGRRC